MTRENFIKKYMTKDKEDFPDWNTEVPTEEFLDHIIECDQGSISFTLSAVKRRYPYTRMFQITDALSTTK